MIRITVCCLFLLAGGQTSVNAGAGDRDLSRVRADNEKAGARETVTLMVYMIGSDLESSASAATNDMTEMAESGIDLSCVNLLVYTGGAQKWHSDVPDDANAVFLLEDDGFRQIESYDQASMGEPDQLSAFLRYGYENYPADSFDLILWDHGNGPVMGYGSDKVYSGDALTLPEIRAALEQSPFGGNHTAGSDSSGQTEAGKELRAEAGGENQPPEGKEVKAAAGGENQPPKLGFIGFDACLMASAELVCTVADYADYLVASQETEPSFGWNYAFLPDLGHVPAGELLPEIVDDYISYCEDYFRGKEFFQSDVTLAAVDLSHASELEQAVDGLFAKAKEDVSGDYNKLAVARVHSHGLGRASTGSEYDLVDLESLLDEMASRYPKETEAVRTALQSSVLSSGANIDGCCGLSLFYPYYNKNYYEAQWKDAYAEIGLFPNYLSYLQRYEQVWLGTDLKESFTEEMVPVKGEEPSVYQMQLTDEQYEQYAQGAYYILQRRAEELYAPVYMSTNVTDKNGLLTAEFGGNAIYVSDDYGKKHIAVTRMWETKDNVTDYSITNAVVERGRLSENEWASCDIQIAVNEETDELTVKGIYGDEQEGDGTDSISGGKKQPVDLDEWTRFSFYDVKERYLTRDEAGRITYFWDWPEGDWITGYEMPIANGVHFTYEPMYDDGQEYYIMFDVQDVQGNHYGSELLPVTLEEAPVKGKVEANILEWTDTNELMLLDEAGVRVRMTYAMDVEGGKNFFEIEAENTNDFEVRFDLGNVIVNGNLSVPDSTTIFLNPGEHKYEALTGIADVCRLAGCRLEKLNFLMGLENYDKEAYLVHERPMELRLSGDLAADAIVLPMLGARADRQILTEKDDIRVELVTFGTLLTPYQDPGSGYTTLQTDLRVDNLSGKKKEINVWGIEINGVYFRIEKSAQIGGGESWYTSSSLSNSNLTGLVVATMEERPERMTSISSARILFGVDGELSWCPIALAEHGDQEPFEPSGELLYEDDQVRLLAFQEAAGETAGAEEAGAEAAGAEEAGAEEGSTGEDSTEAAGAEAGSAGEDSTEADDAEADGTGEASSEAAGAEADGTEEASEEETGAGQDDTFQVRETIWDIWVVNKTDEVISLTILEEGNEPPEYVSTASAGPGAAQLVEAIVYRDPEELSEDGLKVYSQIRTESQEEYRETETYLLPLQASIKQERAQ
ncbi:MAG: hypothetical protein IJ860_04680 [Eubacterium sp.]|nr:hypothetical protein [Eubacterium sp.]